MLSKRLREILDWVQTDCLADIGCDHAWLCIEAIREQRASRALACDVASGPLRQAKTNIQNAGLQHQITTMQTNGLEGVTGADLVVIAGMGASTMIDILKNSDYKGKMILSPHKDPEELRLFLEESGFKILREKIVHDGHFYSIIEAEPGIMRLSQAETLFGINVKPDETYLQYLDYQKRKIKRLLEKVPDPAKQKFETIYGILEQRIQEVSINS